jgi:serine/threonine protein kinase
MQRGLVSIKSHTSYVCFYQKSYFICLSLSTVILHMSVSIKSQYFICLSLSKVILHMSVSIKSHTSYVCHLKTARSASFRPKDGRCMSSSSGNFRLSCLELTQTICRALAMQPLAESIRLKNFVDGDVRSLSRLVNRLAKQLLSCCLALENNGIGQTTHVSPRDLSLSSRRTTSMMSTSYPTHSHLYVCPFASAAHRDVKPYNLLCVDGEMVLIDFGSSAAMGDEERTGYATAHPHSQLNYLQGCLRSDDIAVLLRHVSKTNLT